MPKAFTKYNKSWENVFPFLQPGPSDYEAHCLECDLKFSIKHGGKSDVKRHMNRKCHIEKTVKNSAKSVDKNNNEAPVPITTLTPQEEVLKAETLQALKVVNSNYSFSSTADDGDRFRAMFPDSKIAKNYKMSKTKVSYVIKHGISPVVEEQYINDVKGTPYVFKFDETTTIQCKKQYDGYV